MQLAFQPILNLRTGAVAKVEALVRLAGSDRIAEYIELLEVSGRIKKLTEEVLSAALSDWNRFGRRGVGLSINLSAANLDEADLARRIERALKRHRYDPAALWLELGERSQEMSDTKRVAQMREVAKLGVRFSLDSFADVSIVTLEDLGRLPWREIKIDGRIVAASAYDIEQRERMKSAIEIAKALAIDVTAKGVETANVAALVSRLGCTHGQGLYFAPPAVPEAIGGVLDSLQTSAWVPLEA